MERSSGILLHISSLPSPYGVGGFGAAAYGFVDFLTVAKQKYWQILPLGPTSFGDSPYQSFSTFAGNPYFIDLDRLAQAGLLRRDELPPADIGSRAVDYGALYENRYGVLRRAYAAARNDRGMRTRLESFAGENAAWLEDYALFMALKDNFSGRPWTQWPQELRLRQPQALKSCRRELGEDVNFYRFLQMLFYEQWDGLRGYANAHGVRIIGDLPIYVPLDSADVWAGAEEFQLDENRLPLAVAGVPPDYFTADGQLWGNPLYDWAAMAENGYSWWLRRMAQAARLFDTVRIDHFRGLASYWSVPFGAETARQGQWREGPGLDFVSRLRQAFPQLEIIAEDLGFLTPDVARLVQASGLPNMKVLQFAFDAGEDSNYLPHAYPRECVCYTGTHDNTTVLGWYEGAAQSDRCFARRYLALTAEEGINWGFLRGGMGSVADLFVAQMQDYLGLGDEARMNLPGSIGGGNWRWRMAPNEASPALAQRIAELTRTFGRA